MSAMPAPAERPEAAPRTREDGRQGAARQSGRPAAKSRAAASRPAAHRSGATVRRGTAPRAPRRVSGPSRAASARPPRGAVSATAGGAIALPAPGAPRLADALRRLPDARWLDRLVRGQGWIVLIGIALIGIVAMQVHLLKLNAGIGRAVEHSSTLERQNADLRADVSRLSAPERIQQVAGRLGLVMPAAGDVRYVKARKGSVDARRAAKVMRAPNPRQTPEQLAAAQGAATTETTIPGTSAPVTAPATTGAAAPETTAAPVTTPDTGTATPTPGTTAAPGTADPAAPATGTAPAGGATAAPAGGATG